MPKHGYGRGAECSVRRGWKLANGRWATEDPNPGQQKVEDQRIAEEGKKIIAAKMQDDFVEAVQAVRALEDGDEEDFYPIEAPEEPEEDARPVKRAKADVPAGLLGGEALDNIKYYADLARKQAEEARTRKVPAPKGGMALLGGYDSGDDSD